MIRVVGANPAMDRISTWPPLRLGDVNRAASVAVVPGGKGFNVARAAIRLGTRGDRLRLPRRPRRSSRCGA